MAILVGFEDGDIHTIRTKDIVQKGLLKLEFTKHVRDKKDVNCSVVSIKKDLAHDSITVAYAFGGVYEWDIMKSQFNLLFDAQKPIHCIELVGENKIYVGCSNGDVLIKDRKKLSKSKSIILFDNIEAAVPVRKIVCFDHNDKRCVLFLGGAGNNVVTIDIADKVKNNITLRNDATIIDVSCHNKGDEGVKIITLTKDGEMSLHALKNSTLVAEPTQLPFSLFGNPFVATLSTPITSSFYEDLKSNANIQMSPSWPIAGGHCSYTPDTSRILITAHQDNVLFIWDISKTISLEPLYAIMLPDGDYSIKVIEICQYTRDILIGTSNGVVYIYSFVDASEGELDTYHLDIKTNEITDPVKVQNSPGYILTQTLNFHHSITSINYEPGVHFLGVSTLEGYVVILDTSDSRFKRLFRIGKINEEIQKTLLFETSVKGVLSTRLSICCSSGNILTFDMTQKKMMDTVGWQSAFIGAYIVDAQGHEVSIKKRLWDTYAPVTEDMTDLVSQMKDLLNDSNKDVQEIKPEEASEQMDEKPSSEDLEPRAESEEVKKEISYCGSPTHDLEKFFILVTANYITKYKLPTFEVLHKVKSNAPLGWCGFLKHPMPTVQDENNIEHCIIALDHSSRIHTWNLMCLTQVNLSKGDLDQLCLDRLTPGAMKNTCLLQDILITFDESTEMNLINIFHSNLKYPPPVLIHEIPRVTTEKSKRGLVDYLFTKKESNYDAIVEGKPQTKESQLKSSSDEIRKNLAEAKQRMHERGEKLNQISDKAEQMAEDSRSFAEKARELAERSKKRK